MSAPPAPRRAPPLEALVLRRHDLTTRMRRIVLGGPGLSAFRVPADALGPYIKLHLDGPDGRSLIRTYSVRRFDPVACELHVDILVHGEASPGSRFGARAAPGDLVRLGGPGFIPAAPCASHFLAGDLTALPAIANILEILPASASAKVVVEVPDLDERQPLPSCATAEITWLHGLPGRPSRLVEAIRDHLPEGGSDILVWAGAEAGIARALRDHARSQGLPPRRCQILNYWKIGRPEGGFSYMD